MVDFNNYQVHMYLGVADLRKGIPGLTIEAAKLGIDVTKGKDMVIFRSRDGRTLKILAYDEFGPILIIRKLTAGGFQQIQGLVNGSSTLTITVAQLALYFNGKRIQGPKNCHYG